MSGRRFAGVLLAGAVIFCANAGGTRAQAADAAGPQSASELFRALKYRYIGPPGNRVAAVVGEPGNPNVYYAGAASGGVWKSFDGGNRWYPIFDKESAQSIGSIAIAPSNHQIIWVG